MLHNLKETLLSTEMVVDNEYLSQYCDLILRNFHRKREKFKTQKHHIIPKSFYDIMGTPIDNSSENVVNLIYSDHIFAHYLLSLCTVDKLKYFNVIAVRKMVSTGNGEQLDTLIENLPMLQSLYEFSREYFSTMPIKRSHQLSDDARKRIGDAHRGLTLPQDVINKIKETKQNKSEEEKLLTRRKMSESHRGKKMPDAQRRKISESLTGNKSNSEEVRKQISQRMMGNTIAKGNTVAQGRIWVTNESGSKMIYPSELQHYIELGYTKGRKITKKGEI